MKWLMKRDLFSSLHSIHCDQLGLVYFSFLNRYVLNNENIYVMILLIILQNITVQWY
jgi:hypothetical protein